MGATEAAPSGDAVPAPRPSLSSAVELNLMTADATPERIYVRLPNWVGDVVMAEPALRALRRAFPEAHIAVHGKGHTFGFLRATGHYDEELKLDKSGGLFWPIKEGRRLRARSAPFDLALIFPNSLSSALVARALGVPRRHGYNLNGRGLLLTTGLKAEKEGRLRPTPMVDYYLGLVASAGVAIDDIVRAPSLPVSAEAEAYARDFFERHGVPEREEVWAINPGGAWATKQWIPDRAADLADRIAANGARVLLLGGPDEVELGAAIRARVGTPYVFGMPEEVVPLDRLTAVLQRCRVLVTTDSGPRHFGVAAGIPVVALIGPTHPGYTGVDYDAFRVVCREVECWPCHRPVCPNPPETHWICMREIEPRDVYSTARALIRESGSTTTEV